MICFVALILHDFSCHSWYCGSVVTDHKFYLETISRATCFMLSFIWDIITFSKKTKIYWSIYRKGNRWLSISETCTVTIINIQRNLAVGIIRGDLRNICNSDISVCYFVPLSLDLGTPWGTTRLFTALDLQRMSSVGVHTPLLPPPWRRPLAVSLMFFSQIPTVLPRKQVCCAGWPVAAGVS